MAAVITLPPTDAALLAFSLNLSTKISATPTAYNLTSALASAYATLHANFATALANCDPAVRSKPATATKNIARTVLKTQLRLLALQVQAGPNVTDAQKIELGLTVPAQRQVIPVPTAVPALDIVSVTGNMVRIRIHDGDGEGTRRKPAGVHSAAVCSFVGAEPPTDPTKYNWQGNTTQSIADIKFDDTLAPGTQVWITAMWLNSKEQSGPACAPQGALIGFGMSQAA